MITALVLELSTSSRPFPIIFDVHRFWSRSWNPECPFALPPVSSLLSLLCEELNPGIFLSKMRKDGREPVISASPNSTFIQIRGVAPESEGRFALGGMQIEEGLETYR
ncbi:uncharacterized protein LDX57_003035 [Aspergillus melleus]|uniref:uncharacterized protein n=1 Tax=Aspergillus melleus TaxID=138277 RepID=UPI001E8D2C69|nr:uncharacterized protein LDX57_003035 [Aspergillus melleus]KAH8425278.1 hypothetical protein LDX57_003035 [Aspergillus melleus]